MGWLHRFLHPHCQHCIEQRRCQTCDVYERELVYLRAQNESLINRLTDTPVEINEQPIELPEVNIQTKGWGKIRRELEEQHRITDKLKKDRERELSELENELGVENAS
jgi:hypothetical protein